MEEPGIEFTLQFGRALQRYGAPAHRLESAMSEVTGTLGIEGEFFTTPTMLLASLGQGEARRTFILKEAAGEVDLNKIILLTDLGNEVIGGRVPAAEGLERLHALLKSPPLYGAAVTVVCFAIGSAAVSRFFGAGPKEMAVVLLAGCVVGLLALAAEKFSPLAHVFPAVAGAVVSLIAALAPSVVGPASIPVMTVSGLIVLVPGYTLTVAIHELAQRSLISGTARLHGAILTFFMLGFGVALGASIGTAIGGGVSTAHAVAMPAVIDWIAVLTASVTLAILFRAPLRELPWILAACIITWTAVKWSSRTFGPELGVFIGALTCGSVSNLYARLLDRPAAVTRVPSMILLVPGGLGFLSIASLLEQDVMKGLQTAFSVALMAIALVTGLLISNAFIPTRKKL